MESSIFSLWKASKQRIAGKVRKRYDKPQPPFQRLLANPHLCPEQKSRLQHLFDQLDPLALKASIEAKLKELSAFVR